MPFIANEGQIGDEHVRFYATTFAGSVYVTDKGEMVYLLSSSEPRTGKETLEQWDHKDMDDQRETGWLIQNRS